MIDVNFTLFIQMGHFLIAFWLMKRYLWRPVIAAIDFQRQRRESLEAQLVGQQELLANKQVAIDHVWADAQQAFARHAPELKHTVCAIPPIQSELVSSRTMPDEAMVKALAVDLADKAQAHD